MRLHRCVPVLAAVVSLAGVSAPVAYGSEAMAGSGGTPVPTTQVVQHHSAGSIDWVVGIGAATGIVVLGTGAAATLRGRRALAGSRETRAAG